MTVAKSPRISVIMVDGSFRESFHALDFLADQTLPSDEYEVLWIEYFDRADPELLRRVEGRSNFHLIRLGRTGTYHSSHCFNEGIRRARGELIVIPDGDVILPPDGLERLWQDHAGCDRLAQYLYRFNEPAHAHQETPSLEHLLKVCENTNASNHGACLSVRKRWLLEINGYDTHPIFATGFHCNDLDVYTRLKAYGLFVRWSPDIRVYHPWHPATGIYNANYVPMQKVIDWRARNVEHRTFEGLDSARDMEPPADLMRYVDWVRTSLLPFRQRALKKIRKTLGRAA